MAGTDGRATWGARIAETAAIAAAYAVLARLGQILAIPPGNVTPVYPAAGFAIACVLFRGRRAGPGVWLGQFLGNTWAFVDASSVLALAATTTVGAVTATGALLQALVGAGLIRRFCGESEPFFHVRHVFLFAASVLLACLLSSTAGVATLCISDITPWTHWMYVWVTWYLGDAVGILLVVPVLVTWRAAARTVNTRRRLIEAGLMVALNTALALFVFADLSPISAITNPLVFLSLPLLLWAAVRFNQFGVSLVILIVSSIAAAGTVEGHGPFATPDPTISLWLLQSFVGVSMITGLTFAAALNERKRSEQNLRRTEHKLEENYRIQKAISSLLRISLEPISLEAMLERSLETILSIPWLGLENKGAIFVARQNPGVLEMKAQRGLPKELLELCAEMPVGKCLCGRAASEREIVFSDQSDHRHEVTYAGMSPHGHYCVPITSGEDLAGVMNFYVEAGHEQDPLETRFLGAAAEVLASTIRHKVAEEKLRERDAELILAQRIQEHLLPQRSPVSPGLDIAGAVRPCEFAAGDYFDYLEMPDGALGVVVGDVCGHGFSSALLTCSTSAHIRSYADSCDRINEIVSGTNRLLCNETDAGPFVTLFFARIDRLGRRLDYVNAGHPPGYVLDEFGAAKAVLKGAALPLGITSDTEYSMQGPVDLEPGDTILLMTDGVLEAPAPDRRMFGVERALQVVREHRKEGAREIVERLNDAICEFTQLDHTTDDVTVVVIKVAPRPVRPHEEWGDEGDEASRAGNEARDDAEGGREGPASGDEAAGQGESLHASRD